MCVQFKAMRLDVITEGVEGGREKPKIQVLGPPMHGSQEEGPAKENEKGHPVREEMGKWK